MGDTMDLDGALFEAWEDVESCSIVITHEIHVWHMFLHWVDSYGKCKVNTPYMDPRGNIMLTVKLVWETLVC